MNCVKMWNMKIKVSQTILFLGSIKFFCQTSWCKSVDIDGWMDMSLQLDLRGIGTKNTKWRLDYTKKRSESFLIWSVVERNSNLQMSKSFNFLFYFVIIL